MRRLLALALLVLSTVLLAPAPALACSCAGLPPAEHVGNADVVVSGRVLDHAEARSGSWGGMPSSYLVEARTVWQGEVTERFEVLGGGPNDTCAMEGIETGRQYVFFLDQRDGELHGSLCDGTGSVTERQVDRLLDEVPGQPLGGGPEPAGWSGRGNSDLLAARGALLAVALGLAAWGVRRARRG